MPRLLENRQISASEPFVIVETRRRFLRQAEITLRDKVASDLQFAWFSACDWIAVRIDNPNLGMWQGLPRSADPAFEIIVIHGLRDDRAGFGHSHDDHRLCVKPVSELAHQLRPGAARLPQQGQEAGGHSRGGRPRPTDLYRLSGTGLDRRARG